MHRPAYQSARKVLYFFAPAAATALLTFVFTAGAMAANPKVSFDNLRRTVDKCTLGLSYVAETPGAVETVYSKDAENFRKDLKYSDGSAMTFTVSQKKGWTYEPATRTVADTSEAAVAAALAETPTAKFSALSAAAAEISEKQSGPLLVYTLLDRAKKTGGYRFDFMVELNSGALIRIIEYDDKGETVRDVKYRGHKFGRTFDRAVFKKPDPESLQKNAQASVQAAGDQPKDGDQAKRKNVVPEVARRECLRNLDELEAAAAKYRKEKNEFPSSLEVLVKGSYIAKAPSCQEEGAYSLRAITEPEECAIAKCSFHGEGRNGDHARLAALYSARAGERSAKSDLDGAIANYDKAIELDPTNEVYFLNRGNQYYNKKDFNRAVENYGEAIRINRDFTAAYIWRAEAHREKGELDSALSDCDRAIALDSSECQAFYNRSFIYKMKGDDSKAEADMKTYKDLTEKAPAKEEPKKQ